MAARFLLYFIGLMIALPLELLLWGQAVNYTLTSTFLHFRMQQGPFCCQPVWLLILIGLLSLGAMLFSLYHSVRKPHQYDALFYGGFPLLLGSLLLLWKQECAFAVVVPLVCLGEYAIWYIGRNPGRKPFFPSCCMTRPADKSERWQAVFVILLLSVAGCLVFQEGYLLLFMYPELTLLLLLPLPGVLLHSPGQIREYLIGSIWALVLTLLLFCVGVCFFEAELVDVSIAAVFIFLEVQGALLLRSVLPKIRNISLLILVLSLPFSWLTVPRICSPAIISSFMFVLYILIDNRQRILRFFFSPSRGKQFCQHRFAWNNPIAPAWGLGFILLAYLLGPGRIWFVLASILMILLGSLIRDWQLKQRGGHPIMKDLPYLNEVILLVLLLLYVVMNEDKFEVIILLSAYACTAAFICMIQCTGTSNGLDRLHRRATPVLLSLSYALLFLLLLILFFLQSRASLLLGSFCILTGFIRIGESAFRKTDGHLRRNAGWVLIAAGQMIFIMPLKTALPRPEWNTNDLICGLVAFAVLFFVRNLRPGNQKIKE